MRILPAALLLTTLAFAPALRAADTWTANDAWLKGAINDCLAAGQDRTVCRHFTGDALRKLFDIGDFCKPKRCLKAVEIEWEVRNAPARWEPLGTAADQAVLDKARDLAGQGKAVLAVENERDRGQIAILMPGAAVPSGKWKLKVPIAVAARVDKPEKSVYGRSLNWIFDAPEGVKLYVRR